MVRLGNLVLLPLVLALVGCGGAKPTGTAKPTGSSAGPAPSAQGPKLSPDEASMKGSVDLMVEVAVIVESIKDDKSADEAIAKLKQAKGRMVELEGKIKGISPEKMKPLAEKYMKDVMGTGERIEKAKEQALKNAPGKAKELSAALDDK